MPARLAFRPRGHPSRVRSVLLALCSSLALWVVTGCGAGPGPVADLQIEGKVVLPPGSALDLTELVARGPFGSSQVSSDGTFAVPMAKTGDGLVTVTDQAGDLVLMGFLDTAATGDVSARTTAAALLYLAVGGPFMSDDARHVLDLVDADVVLPGLAAQVGTVLASEPRALATGDTRIVDAVLAARDAIAARREAVAAQVSALAGPPALPHDVQGSGNVIITDPGVRGGFDLLISDDGLGVKVQNTLRRPARLLLYQTGVKSEEGPVTMFSNGRAVGESVSVPPTRSINLFLALEDAMGGGGSPLEPIESDSVALPLLEGSTRTYYTAVLLAPSLIPGATPPIFTDSRFFPYRPQWDAILDDLSWETWWTSLLFPLMSTMAFGVTSQVAYANVAAHSADVRAASAPVLAADGITNPISGDRAKAMTAAIERAALGSDSTYFYELVEHTRQSLDLPAPSSSGLQSARAYMGSMAKAAGVLAVVDALMSSADIVAMLYDMGSNGPAETYDPIRLQTRAEIRPHEGQVQRLVAPSQVFNVVIDEPLDGGAYLYRWQTTGEYGFISDYLQEGDSFDSHSDEIFYLANEPAAITPELHDEITVEVYLDDGSGVIEPGAEPVTVATATVVGKERRDLISGRLEAMSDSYPSGDTTRYCSAAYVAFERQPDATRYTVEAFNFYDPYYYYYYGHFGATVYESPDFQTFQPPCDEHSQSVLGNDIYLFLSGGNGPDPLDDSWWQTRFGGMLVEVTVVY